MTQRVSNIIKQKEEAWVAYRKRRTRARYRAYCIKRNRSTKAVREAIYQFEMSLAQEVKENPRAFYAYARSKTRIKETVSKLKHPDGSTTNSPQEACNLLNAAFQRVFTRELDTNIPDADYQFQGNELCNIEFSIEDVKKVLEGLKEESAPGPDGVHPKVLKECAASLAFPLWLLFKSTLAEGRIPEDWNKANITPIFKKGDKSSPLNYRPVSLTSVPCKIMEKIVKRGIVGHLEENQLLSNLQHGFRSGRSCLTQLLEYLEDLEDALDDGDAVDVIYLDCRKAFDTVPHLRLLKKLRAVGIGGDIVKWIESFLNNRVQRVATRGSHSQWLRVWSGVPQGSVLGPILFLVYVNDLMETVQSEGKLFADDTKIYRRIKTSQDGEILQDDLSKLQEWSRKWLLTFNEDKCKVMHVGRRYPGGQYHLGNTPLSPTTLEKDLGVHVTPDLKPATQVAKAAASANSMVGLLRRTYTCLDIDMFLPLYKSLIRPRLEHCIQAWSPYTRRDINKLEQVQRRATKMVPELAEQPYEERLRRRVNNAGRKKEMGGHDPDLQDPPWD